MNAMKSLAALVFMIGTVPLEAQFGMPPKPRRSPVKGDLPAIKCQVCHALIDHLQGKVAEMREEAPYGKVHEDDISNVVEEACDPTKLAGRWISEFDVIEGSGRYLELHKPGGVSHCKEECETIAKSCSGLVDDELDVEELVVGLWKNKLELEALRKVACEEWSERCSGSRIKAPKDRIDFDFEEKSAKDVEMDDLMATLQGSGLGGSMGGSGMQAYTPDDLEAMQDMMGGMGMDGLGDMMDDYGGGLGGDFEF